MKGVLFAILGALSTTFMGRIVHSELGDLTSVEAAFIRNLGMAAILLPWVAPRLKILTQTKAHPLWIRGAIGVVGVLLFFKLLRMAPVSDALFLSNLTPVATLLLAGLVLKERPSSSQWMGTVFILGALIVRTAPGIHPMGPALILFAGLVALVQACAYISIKRSLNLFDPTIVIFTFCLASLLVVPFLSPRWELVLSAFSRREIWLLIFFGLGTQYFMTRSFELLSAGQATLLGQTSIFFAGALEIILAERRPQIFDWLATLLLFFGLALVGNLVRLPNALRPTTR